VNHRPSVGFGSIRPALIEVKRALPGCGYWR